MISTYLVTSNAHSSFREHLVEGVCCSPVLVGEGIQEFILKPKLPDLQPVVVLCLQGNMFQVVSMFVVESRISLKTGIFRFVELLIQDMVSRQICSRLQGRLEN